MPCLTTTCWTQGMVTSDPVSSWSSVMMTMKFGFAAAAPPGTPKAGDSSPSNTITHAANTFRIILNLRANQSRLAFRFRKKRWFCIRGV